MYEVLQIRQIRQLDHYMEMCEELCYNFDVEQFYNLECVLQRSTKIEL